MSSHDIAEKLGCKREQVDREIKYQKFVKLVRTTNYGGSYVDPDSGKRGVMIEAADLVPDDAIKNAPEQVKQVFHLLDKCKFKNGDATAVIKDAMDLPRDGRKLTAQLHDTLARVKKRPDVALRLGKTPRRHAIDRIVSELKSARTVIAKAVHDGKVVHDRAYADAIHEVTIDIHRLLTQLVDENASAESN